MRALSLFHYEPAVSLPTAHKRQPAFSKRVLEDTLKQHDNLCNESNWVFGSTSKGNLMNVLADSVMALAMHCVT